MLFLVSIRGDWSDWLLLEVGINEGQVWVWWGWEGDHAGEVVLGKGSDVGVLGVDMALALR